MPCFTRIEIKVSDETALQAALDALGGGFRDVAIVRTIDGKNFVAQVGDYRSWQMVRSEYARQVTMTMATKAGFTVTRQGDNLRLTRKVAAETKTVKIGGWK